MTDTVSLEKRSLMMRGIRSKDTKPEVLVRQWLHRKGLRFRLHRKDLPGKPDIVLPKWGLVILVHGCFFHHHQDCKLAYIPKSRTEWWMEKFRKNRERDLKTLAELEKLGWKVLVIWECQIRKGVYREILLEYFFPQKKKEQEQ